MPLTLAGPLPTCRYCSATDPLLPGLAARLATMRARLAQRGAQQRHLTGKLVASVTGIQGATLAIWITMWTLFGGMALAFALDHDVALLDFVRGEAAGMDLSARWWMLLGLATGLPLSLFAFGLSLYWLRSMGTAALPLAPAYPGAPPRCRVCAGELPDGTALRRCGYCGTDNLVAGEQYQKSELDLDLALHRIGRRFDLGLARRVALADKTAMSGAMLPIGLLLLMPLVGLAVQAALPILWIMPPVFLLLALLALLLASTRKLPDIDPLECLVLDAEVTVAGTAHTVSAQLLLGAAGGSRRVLDFFGTTRRDLALAGHSEHSGKRRRHTVWDVHEGGTPLAEAEIPRLEPAELQRPGATMKEGVAVDAVRALNDHGSYRLWLAHRAAPGALPDWTLAQRRDSPLILTR